MSELQKAIATVFEFIEKTQAGDWQELQDLLEELEREEGWSRGSLRVSLLTLSFSSSLLPKCKLSANKGLIPPLYTPPLTLSLGQRLVMPCSMPLHVTEKNNTCYLSHILLSYVIMGVVLFNI